MNQTETVIREVVLQWGTEILEAAVIMNYSELKKDLGIIAEKHTGVSRDIELSKSLLSLSALNSPAMTSASSYVSSREFIEENYVIDTEELDKNRFSYASVDALTNLLFRLSNSFERPNMITEDEQLHKLVQTTISGVYKKDLLIALEYVESRKPIKYRLLYPILIVSIYKDLLAGLAIKTLEKYFK